MSPPEEAFLGGEDTQPGLDIKMWLVVWTPFLMCLASWHDLLLLLPLVFFFFNSNPKLRSLKGKVEGIDWGFGIGICTPRYMERLAKGDLLCSTENATQYSVIIYLGKESEWIYVYA